MRNTPRTPQKSSFMSPLHSRPSPNPRWPDSECPPAARPPPVRCAQTRWAVLTRTLRPWPLLVLPVTRIAQVHSKQSVTAQETQPPAGTAGPSRSRQLRPRPRNSIPHRLLPSENPQPELRAHTFPRVTCTAFGRSFCPWALAGNESHSDVCSQTEESR